VLEKQGLAVSLNLKGKRQEEDKNLATGGEKGRGNPLGNGGTGAGDIQ